MATFCVNVRFLRPAFHGKGDGDRPEWPPSPHRLFQALVASAARQGGGSVDSEARRALRWLESRAAPAILAPRGVSTRGYSLSVPHNAMDVVASAWARGNYSNRGDANPATHRTMKRFSPTLLDDGALRYLWEVDDSEPSTVTAAKKLSELARGVVALGLGIDTVVADADLTSADETVTSAGECWRPQADDGPHALRVPFSGSLDELLQRHESFLRRLTNNVLTPPPPVSVYARRAYRRDLDVRKPPLAGFRLLKPDGSGTRVFDTAWRSLTVAAMSRHAVKRAAERAGWDPDKIAAFVLGHGEASGGHHRSVGPFRFSYWPLPTIEDRGRGVVRIGDVRRVAITSLGEACAREVAWALRALPGQDLRGEGSDTPAALLAPLATDDFVFRRYSATAAEWATVTPMVLPGYDDPAHYRRRLRDGVGIAEQKQMLQRLGARIEGLIRKAMVQGGLAPSLAAHADVEWRPSGFFAGCMQTSYYGVPDHLRRFSRYHVRLLFRDSDLRPIDVSGPICLGGGRFMGVGLFAPLAQA